MLDWLKKAGVRRTLQAAAGHSAVTHEAPGTLPPGRTLVRLRSMLVAAGALPARDERLVTLERWIGQVIAGRTAPEHRRALHGYAVWHQLRRLRSRLQGRPASGQQVKDVRDQVTAAAAFLDWLEARGLTLGTCTRAELDQWPAGNSSYLARPANFARWADARRLLHDDTCPVADRVAGLLILLCAQKLSVIAALTTQHVRREDGRTLPRPGSRPIVLPAPLDALAGALAGGRKGSGHQPAQCPFLLAVAGTPARKPADPRRSRPAAACPRDQPAPGSRRRPVHPGRRCPGRDLGQDPRHPRQGRHLVAENLRRRLEHPTPPTSAAAATRSNGPGRQISARTRCPVPTDHVPDVLRPLDSG